MKLGLLASAFAPFPHPGHLWAIQQAIESEACNAVYAAIQVDPSRDRPDKARPETTIEERVKMVGMLRDVVDLATYQTEAELEQMIAVLKPACLIVGEDHRDDPVTGSQYAPVFWAQRRPDWSSTEFRRRIVAADPEAAAALRFCQGMKTEVLQRYTADDLQRLQAIMHELAAAWDRFQETK